MTEEANVNEVLSNDDLGVKAIEPEQVAETQDGDSSSEAELVFGKYKDMSAAEEAFKTLESENGRLRREKTPEAPEEYTVDFSEDEDFAAFSEAVSAEALKDNEYLNAILPSAKKHGISQEAINDMVKDYLKVDLATITSAKEEFKSLGDEGVEMLTSAQRFISKFPEEEQALFAGLGIHPDGILSTFKKENLQLITKLMNMTGEKSIPDSAQEAVTTSPDELKAKAYEIKNTTKNFEYNTEAQARYEKLMNDAAIAELKKKSA